MKVIEVGHVYEVSHLDGDGTHQIVFVNRESGREHEGTQCQEVIRVLIDRVKYLENQLHWGRNEEIINHLRMALVLFEQRAMERKVEKGLLQPEKIATGRDGHFLYVDKEAYVDTRKP